jgi:hypothetical protein
LLQHLVYRSSFSYTNHMACRGQSLECNNFILFFVSFLSRP